MNATEGLNGSPIFGQEIKVTFFFNFKLNIKYNMFFSPDIKLHFTQYCHFRTLQG